MGEYGRLSSVGGTSVTAVSCRSCNTLLAIVPSNLDKIAQKLDRLR